jgi:hypothetical protein
MSFNILNPHLTIHHSNTLFKISNRIRMLVYIIRNNIHTFMTYKIPDRKNTRRRTRLRRGYTAHPLALGFCCVPPLPSPRASGSPSPCHCHSHRIPSQFSLLHQSLAPLPTEFSLSQYRPVSCKKIGFETSVCAPHQGLGFEALHFAAGSRGPKSLRAFGLQGRGREEVVVEAFGSGCLGSGRGFW